MPKTSDIDLGRRLMICLKGDSGSGKTILSSSFPGPMYYYDVDGRMKPVKLMRPDRTDIEYDPYNHGDTEKLLRHFEALQNRCPWKTVDIASLTSLGINLIHYSMEKLTRSDANKIGIIDGTDIRDFGAESRALERMIAIARKLPCHFILEAHTTVQDIKDTAGRVVGQEVRLLTGGKNIAKALPGYFDEIWHLRVRPSVTVGKPPIREILTASDGIHFAKTSLPLPPVIQLDGLDFFGQLKRLLDPKGIKLTE